MLRGNNNEISEYVSGKNAKKLLSKYCKAKLSVRGLEAINLFLDQFLVLLVKHRNTANKYGITHYQSILTKVIKDEVLLRSCMDEARSRSAQMITGLSLNYVMSIQDMIKSQDTLDRFPEDDPHFKARYLSQLRQFIVSCSLLSSNQYSITSNSRPGAQYFSLPVGLFIGNAVEQISRFLLLNIGTEAHKEKLKTISADRVAYIFFHNNTINEIAETTGFFSSFEVLYCVYVLINLILNNYIFRLKHLKL
ncbi:hypothetical protein K502DRAFT_255451 [Neoconidiobolus thromboides FSU 785]|nr:hypothetical protein K502DRAFT_255451 [Neoconidiobolus thromboides FSU 785]